MATLLRSTLVLVTMLFIAPVAQANVLTFDEPAFVHGTVVNSQYAPLVTISAQNVGGGPNLAVAFNSTLSNTQDPDLEGTFDSNNGALADAFDPGNILIIQENDSGCGDGTCNSPDDEGDRPAGIISFQFTRAIELLSLDFFDVETAEDGATANNRIRLYDTANTEVFANTYYTPDTGGDNMWDQVLFGQGLMGIGRIEVYMGGSGAIDNLVYNVVPVPAAIWLFGTALLGFIGFSRRTSL
jgi:hypothetical protein